MRLPGFMEVARGRPAQLVVGSRGPEWPVTVSELGDDDRVRHVGAHHGASYLEHVDFCAAIRSGDDAAVTVDDGLWSVAMGAGHRRSTSRVDRRGAPGHARRDGPAGDLP